MTEQIGLHKFKLTQQRYNGGCFYMSAVLHGGELEALDGRFFIEDGYTLTPTRSGFRLPIENLNDLIRLLSGDLREISDTVLIENSAFRFHVRYVNDKYGEGVDFRKYRTSTKYTGWDKAGIRMKLEDVETMRDWLHDFDRETVLDAPNLFANKTIGGGQVEGEPDNSSLGSDVNATIRSILES